MKPPSHRTRPAGLTLVEMLIVIAIMVGIAVIAIPAFNQIGKSSSLTAGGNLVTNLAGLARQNAMSRNVMTAMVLLTAQGSDSDYRALTLLEIAPRSDGTALASADWRQISKWEILPDGVVVDPIIATSTFLDSGPVVPALPPLTFHDKPVNALAHQVFLPDGRITKPTSCVLRVLEAAIVNGRPIYTNRTDRNAPANYYDISILAATGRVKVDRP